VALDEVAILFGTLVAETIWVAFASVLNFEIRRLIG